MQRLMKILETLPTPAFVVSAVDWTILVANRRAGDLAPGLADQTGDLTGFNLDDVTRYHKANFEDHPAVRARTSGVHSLYYAVRDVTVVASRLPDAPTRPPAVVVTARKGDSEPLAVAEHMRVMSNYAIASAIDDLERNISIAHRMLAVAHDRLQDLAGLWHERVEAYAESEPDPLAEFALLDAANERSERTSDIDLDVSVASGTLMPLQSGTT